MRGVGGRQISPLYGGSGEHALFQELKQSPWGAVMMKNRGTRYKEPRITFLL